MTTTAAVVPAKPARRRWLRGVLIALALVILIPLALYVYSSISTRNAWDAAVAEAERDLPRWRLLELEEDRPTIPDAENSALHMSAISRNAKTINVSGAPGYNEIFPIGFPANVELNVQQIQLIRGRLALIQESLAEARKLKDMPRGRFPVRYSDLFYDTIIPEHQKPRMFADWLSHDAFLLAQERKPDEAIESCHAILNAGRAIEGEQMFVAHFIRIAMQNNHAATLERVLAQDATSEQALQRVQTLLDREIKESSMLPATRGERAGMNHLMENINDGKVDPAILGDLGGAGTNRVGDIMNIAIHKAFPGTCLKFYPEFLHFMNRNVNAVKLPIHERDAMLKELEKEWKGTGNLLLRSFSPAMVRINQADMRGQANLRATLAAVACERYRLAHEDKLWPESLDALVAARLLDPAPTDPFDGKPLRFRRTKEGIVIYSVGVDLKDDNGNIDHERWNEPGIDIGFRLWSEKNRRQPPRPPVVVQPQEAP